MAIEAVAFGKSLSVLSLQMNYSEFQIPTIDLSVPLREIAGQDVYFQDIAFYRDGQFLESGFIRTPQIIPDLSDSTAKVRLRCQNELGRLECEGPLNLRLNQALPWAAIDYLLKSASQDLWVMGDNRAFSDPIDTSTYYPMTIDLSGAQNLWEQLVKVGKNIAHTSLYFRAGAARGENGFYQLDMGTFAEQSDSNRIISGQNTVGPATINTPTREPLRRIIPMPGHPDVFLSDALNIDPSLASHPDYPLDAISQSVLNNAVTKGCFTKQTFDDVKPASDTPSQSELDNAAYELYGRAVSYLARSQPYISISQKCFLEQAPRLYEQVWFDNLVHEYDYNLYSGQFEIVQTFRLQQWMRIANIKVDYRERFAALDPYTGQPIPNEVYQLELTTSARQDIYDPSLVLYETLKPAEETFTDLVLSQYDTLPDALTSVTHSAAIADCDGVAKTFALPPIPDQVISPPAGPHVFGLLSYPDQAALSHRLRILQPASLTDSQIVCASGNSGQDWHLADDLTIDIRYVSYSVTGESLMI